jgi:hypothetical protein
MIKIDKKLNMYYNDGVEENVTSVVTHLPAPHLTEEENSRVERYEVIVDDGYCTYKEVYVIGIDNLFTEVYYEYPYDNCEEYLHYDNQTKGNSYVLKN